MPNVKTTNDYKRLARIVQSKGFKLHRSRGKLVREWNAGYYIVDPETDAIIAGMYHNGDLGMSPGDVVEWCNSD